jgi:hypothetical protein
VGRALLPISDICSVRRSEGSRPVSRDYRGSVTDHNVKVGDCQLTVTTHKFCTLSTSIEKRDVYLYIPPEAIKPLKID